MVSILIYNTDDERIDRLCDKYDTTAAEIIQALLDNAEGDEDEIFT